jgi:aromatic ring-cleaving dioxygenase
VLAHQSNASLVARGALVNSFCNFFDVGAGGGELHFTDDGTLFVPLADFDTVVPWLQEARISPNGDGVDLDLWIYPNSGCGAAVDQGVFSMWAGERHDTLLLDTSRFEEAAGGADSVVSTADDNDWAYTCNIPEICPDTFPECVAAPDALGYHLHLFYDIGNEVSTAAKDSFVELISTEFEIPTDFPSSYCKDTEREQMHDSEICWVTGPSGEPTLYPGDGTGASFSTSWITMLIPADDFDTVVPWIMAHRTSAHLGYTLDYLVHPFFGCVWVDNMPYPLIGGEDWPRNPYGIALSAGYEGSTPTAMDASGPNFPRPSEGNACDTAPFQSYRLNVLYDALDRESTLAKDALVESMLQSFGAGGLVFVQDTPAADQDPSNPFLNGVVELSFPAEIMAGVVPTAMQSRAPTSSSAWLDIMVSPMANCPYSEYTRWSLSGGFGGAMNQYAVAPVESRSSSENCKEAAGWDAFLLYLPYTSNNVWAAEGLEFFLSAFSREFTSAECSDQYPALEPDYSAKGLCLMGKPERPFASAQDPFPVAHAGIHVPRENFAEVVSWVMQNRASEFSGYDLDVLLVPLSSCPMEDYLQWRLFAGHSWRLNELAM